jgi:hypothetical protein
MSFERIEHSLISPKLEHPGTVRHHEGRVPDDPANGSADVVRVLVAIAVKKRRNFSDNFVIDRESAVIWRSV